MGVEGTRAEYGLSFLLLLRARSQVGCLTEVRGEVREDVGNEKGRHGHFLPLM